MKRGDTFTALCQRVDVDITNTTIRVILYGLFPQRDNSYVL